MTSHYLNETISLGKARVLDKIKHLKCELMPQSKKQKVLQTHKLTESKRYLQL